MCKVYPRFVQNFARIAKLLSAFTSNTLSQVLEPPSKAETKAFETLKQALLSPPVLALPHLHGAFVIDVDACDTQVGCTQLQARVIIGDDEKIPGLHPVGYFSRALNSAERNYRATERECVGHLGSSTAQTVPGGTQVYRAVRPRTATLAP